MERMRITGVMEQLRPIVNKGFKKIKRQRVPGAIVTTFAGDGTSGFLDGSALKAKFKSPIDVAVLPDGVICVADIFNSCIRKIEHNQVTTFAGNGNANIINGNGRIARFKMPSRLALDGEGNLYALDAADPRVRKITPAAEVSILAGERKFGFKDGKASIAQFGQSFGIVTDTHGNLYIADSQNDCIRKISLTGVVTTVAGNEQNDAINRCRINTQFHFITGIAIDKEENMFISDLTRIHKIDPGGNVSTIAGTNVKGFADGKRAIAKFSQIEDLIIDRSGNLYATDENRIRKITPDGIVTTIAGSTAGYQDGDGTSAKFDGPQGLGIDKDGNIYVADFNNRRIRKISFE